MNETSSPDCLNIEFKIGSITHPEPRKISQEELERLWAYRRRDGYRDGTEGPRPKSIEQAEEDKSH
ncbi:hypothetical protein BH11PLA2_BH11PLA2_33910 [soil metagenome]